MSNKQTLIEITRKISEQSTSADAQENFEVSQYYGMMSNFKPSPYLKSMRKEINRLEKILVNLAKKTGQEEWDRLVDETKVCPELYTYESLMSQ